MGVGRGTIVRGAIVLDGNCPRDNCPGDNCLGDNCSESNCPGGILLFPILLTDINFCFKLAISFT